ncbi:MAG: porin family protein [Epsilonproteobacteria bacterium]|nr:porin family protein [Campylobacterota bacterium]
MKKTILILLLASGLATAGSFAQVGAGYAKGDNDGDMLTAFGGLNVLGNLGLRLEYTKNISEHPEFSKDDVSRYGLFATYTLPLTPNFSVTPKAGLTQTDGEFSTLDTIETVSDSSTEFTYGLEINYSYNELISLFVGYTDYGKELDIKDIDTSKLDTANYTFGIKIDI